MACYHLELNDYICKPGFTGNHRHDARVGWQRPHELIKQYKKLNFNKATLKRIYTRAESKNADSETYQLEQVCHAIIGAAGHHTGNKKKHGVGWTEVFAITNRQMVGYFGKAFQICNRLDWNIKAIEEWYKNYCLKHFKVESWPEYVMNIPPEKYWDLSIT